MPKLRPVTFAALTLPLLLAACGSAGTPTSTAVASGDLVSLTLNSGLGAVTPQGLPSNGAVSAVTFIKVNVTDASGKSVTFDGSNVYKAGGTQTFITLSNTTPSAKLLLPRGTYRFENIGKQNAAGPFLAYGQDTQDLGPLNPSVNLTLHTLISAANSTLASKLPTNYVNTADKLDLRLAVKTPNEALDVPLSDYTVTYSNTDATVLTSSKLGANVQVVGTTTQTSASVDATVTGYVATGAETATVQNQKVTYTVPLSVTGLSTDATPPTVTFSPVSSRTNTAMTLSGTANDNKAIGQVRVFDGSVLIGSTSADDVTAGAALITFTGTTWSFTWTSGSAAPELMVVASDAAGNESRAVPQTDSTVPWTGGEPAMQLPPSLGVTDGTLMTETATFFNLPKGPVDLRMDLVPDLQHPNVPASVALNTRQVEGDGLHPLVFQSLFLAGTDYSPLLRRQYTVTASQNGKDLVSVPVTFQQSPNYSTISYSPGPLSGPVGTVRRITLTITYTSPLASVPAVGFGPLFLGGTGSGEALFEITPTGVPYGDFTTGHQDYLVKLVHELPQHVHEAYDVYIASGLGLGYRLPFYGTKYLSVAWQGDY